MTQRCIQNICTKTLIRNNSHMYIRRYTYTYTTSPHGSAQNLVAVCRCARKKSWKIIRRASAQQWDTIGEKNNLTVRCAFQVLTDSIQVNMMCEIYFIAGSCIKDSSSLLKFYQTNKQPMWQSTTFYLWLRLDPEKCKIFCTISKIRGRKIVRTKRLETGIVFGIDRGYPIWRPQSILIKGLA